MKQTEKITITLLLFLISLFVKCQPACHNIDIGSHIEEIPAPMKKSSELAFMHIGLALETWETRIADTAFSFAFDSKGEIIYLQSASPSFHTPEGLSLNNNMADCLRHSNQDIRVIPGIAFYIPLESGWNVEIGDIFQNLTLLKEQKAPLRFFFKRHKKLSQSLSFEDYLKYSEQSDILPLLEKEGNRKVFSRKLKLPGE